MLGGLHFWRSRSFVSSKRKEQLVAIRIGDPDHVVTPPRFLSRHRSLQDLTAKLIDPIPIELHEQAAFVLAFRIFTQDDLALSTIDLADCPLAVACMPLLLETQTNKLNSATPVSILKELMAARNLQPRDLWEVFGSKSLTSEVLNGNRDISKSKAKALAEFFHVSAELLI